MREFEAIVKSVGDEQKEIHGFVPPKITADTIASRVGIADQGTIFALETIFRHTPTAEFIYPDAFTGIGKLLSHGDYVGLWTDDFLDRVGSSGFGEFRKSLTVDARKRLSIHSHRSDKTQVLPEAVEKADRISAERIVIVDDKPTNLLRAGIVLEDLGVNGRGQLVHMTRETTTDLPAGALHVAQTMPQLLSLRDVFASSSEKILWMIDFNGPIHDQEGYTNKRYEIAAGEIERTRANYPNEGSGGESLSFSSSRPAAAVK